MIIDFDSTAFLICIISFLKLSIFSIEVVWYNLLVNSSSNFKNRLSTFKDKSTSLYLSFDLFFNIAIIESSSELKSVFVKKLFLAL